MFAANLLVPGLYF